METPYTKRVKKFMEAVAATSTATDDQVILRTSTPGAPMLTLDDIKKAVTELELLFIAAEEAGYMGKQLTTTEYLH
mgnify:CR=1 FL=1